MKINNRKCTLLQSKRQEYKRRRIYTCDQQYKRIFYFIYIKPKIYATVTEETEGRL